MERQNFLILGAGMQGRAIAFDLAKFARAGVVIITDKCLSKARKASSTINQLIGKKIVRPKFLDISSKINPREFQNFDVVINALPYQYNLLITEVAIEATVSLCDLGGNTAITLEQLKLNSQARKANITILPDCGLMPGLSNVLAIYGLSQLEECEQIKIYCGGLPQNPRPPLKYKLVFSLEGLINEYREKSIVLRNNKISFLDSLTELEEVVAPKPLGKCEAFLTAGGVSTLPWTLEGKVKTLEGKTIRYPGHYQIMKSLKEVGLMKDKWKELLFNILRPLIDFPADKDLVILRVVCSGKKEGKIAEIIFEVLDFYDESSGFSAMERTTGFTTAIIANIIGEGKFPKGVMPLESVFSEKELLNKFVKELRKRKIKIKKRLILKQVSFLRIIKKSEREM